jgi:hypothetical protein
MDPMTVSLIWETLRSAIRHAMTLGAGALVTYGLIDKAGAEQLVNLMLGLVMAAIAMGWSYYQKRGQVKVQNELDKIKKFTLVQK